MASVDDMIDRVNSPSSGGAQQSKRIATKALTESEKDGLREQGYDVDGSEFVDIELEPVPGVDELEEKRRKAVDALTSVSSPVKAGETVKRDAAPSMDADLNEKIKDLEGKVKQYEEVLAKTPAECLRCGWPTGEKVVTEPSKEDIANFLRSVMAGEVYKKSYILFNDELNVTFRTRTGAEDARIREVVRRMIREGEILQQVDMLSQVRRLNFACSLDSYTTKLGSVSFQDEELVNGDDLPPSGKKVMLFDAATARIDRLPSHLLAVLIRKFDEFSELTDLLTAKASDPGFWTGTGN